MKSSRGAHECETCGRGAAAWIGGRVDCICGGLGRGIPANPGGRVEGSRGPPATLGRWRGASGASGASDVELCCGRGVGGMLPGGAACDAIAIAE